MPGQGINLAEVELPKKQKMKLYVHTFSKGVMVRIKYHTTLIILIYYTVHERFFIHSPTLGQSSL